MGAHRPVGLRPRRRRRDPWRWAGIHALFIVALGVVNIVSWRMNEDAREAQRGAQRGALPLARSRTRRSAWRCVGLDGRVLRVNDRLREPPATPRTSCGLRVWTTSRPPARPATAAWPTRRAGGEVERRFAARRRHVGWGLWQHSLVRDGDGRRPLRHRSASTSPRARSAEQRARPPGPPRPADRPAEPRAVPRAPARRSTAAASGGRASRSSSSTSTTSRSINDSLGHGAGDRLLAQRRRAAAPRAAARRTCSPASAATSSRSCLPASPTRPAARRVADAPRQPRCARRSMLDGSQRFVTASIGIAVVAAGEADPEELLRDADAAMYRAKELGKARCEVFDDALRAARGRAARARGRAARRARARRSCGSSTSRRSTLRDAAASSASRRCCAGSTRRAALISPAGVHPDRRAERPDRPDRRLGARRGLPPGRGVARASSAATCTMSVNVSPRQLAPRRPADVVDGALRRQRAARRALLCLEITESALMDDPEAAHGALQRAEGARRAARHRRLRRRLLVAVASSSTLLPVDVIKIDKSFVDGASPARRRPRDHRRAIMRLAARARPRRAWPRASRRAEQAARAARARLRLRPGLSLRAAAAAGGLEPPARARLARRAGARRLALELARGRGDLVASPGSGVHGSRSGSPW